MYSLSVLLSLPSFAYSNLDGMAGMLPLLIVACIASGFILNLIQIFILNRINQKNITTKWTGRIKLRFTIRLSQALGNDLYRVVSRPSPPAATDTFLPVTIRVFRDVAACRRQAVDKHAVI